MSTNALMVPIRVRALHEMTCRIANVMRAHGIGKGDRVGVYMPMCPTTAAVMLACARIGYNSFHFILHVMTLTQYLN